MPLLSKILGHSHERTTRLYAHLVPDHLAEARNVVLVKAPTPRPVIPDDAEN